MQKDFPGNPIELQAELRRAREALARESALRKEREIELKEARETILQTDRARSEFLSSLSHELRTPLNIVQGYTEYLIEDTPNLDTQEIIENLHRIAGGSRAMLEMVTGAVDLARMECGARHLSPEEADLFLLARSVIAELDARPLANKARFQLVKPDFYTHVRVDTALMTQVIRFLLRHIIKIIPTGGLINCRFVRRNGNMVRFLAEPDSALAEETIAAVRARFNAQPTERIKGLGLSLCREVILAHQGSIQVDTAPNGNTVYSFDLRLSTAA
ncbi:MAG: histidine kinase dimerization/phospho-acceptor domain-containing protein [Acidobacteriota bacterium]|nr:histidine kinase dimerization/phospho-acceptor domain-containing protein [Acidobacteriota bacterium]